MFSEWRRGDEYRSQRGMADLGVNREGRPKVEPGN